MKIKFLYISMLTLWFVSIPAYAQSDGRAQIYRTSANHTEIVLHNTSPEALQKRSDEQAASRARREAREQREHELALARIQNSQPATESAQRNSPHLEPLRERQARQEYQPPDFFNGGQYVGFSGGYGGFGFSNFGFGFGFGNSRFRRGRRGFRGRSGRRGFRGRSGRRGFRGRSGRRGFRGGSGRRGFRGGRRFR